MSTHALYVGAAYGISALVIAALVLWAVLDHRARRRELDELAAAGVRRRSESTAP